jgi:hypothetical protein
VFIVCFLLSWRVTWQWLWTPTVRSYWLAWLLCYAVKKLLLFAALSRAVLAPGSLHRVLRPAAFGAYSLFLHLFGLFTGVSSSLTRLCYYVALAVVGLMRVDVTLLPTPVADYDSSYTSFMALCYALHMHTAPLMLHAAGALAAGAGASSARDGQAGQRRKLARNRWLWAYWATRMPHLVRYRTKTLRPLGGDVVHTHAGARSAAAAAAFDGVVVGASTAAAAAAAVAAADGTNK